MREETLCTRALSNLLIVNVLSYSSKNGISGSEYEHHFNGFDLLIESVGESYYKIGLSEVRIWRFGQWGKESVMEKKKPEKINRSKSFI